MILGVYAAVFTILFIAHPLEFLHIEDLLLLKNAKLVLKTPFLILVDTKLELIDFLLFILVNIIEF